MISLRDIARKGHGSATAFGIAAIVALGVLLAAAGALVTPDVYPVVTVVTLALLLVMFVPGQWFLPAILLTPILWEMPLSSSGLLSRLYVGNIMVALTLLRYSLAARRLWSLLPEIGRPLAALCLVSIISLAASIIQSDPSVVYDYPHESVPRWITISTQLGLIVLVWLCPRIGESPFGRETAPLTWTAFYVGAALATVPVIGSSILHTGTAQLLGHTRPEGQGFWFGCAALPFMVNDFLLGRGSRVVLISTISIVLAAAALSFTRQIWIWTIIAVAVPLVLRQHGGKRLGASCAALAAIVVVMWLGAGEFFNPEAVRGLERVNYYGQAVSYFMRHPIFGIGTGNFQFFSIADSGAMEGGVGHNQAMTLLAESGVTGVLALTWLAIGLLQLAAKMPVNIRPAAFGFVLSWLSSWGSSETAMPTAAHGGGTGPAVVSTYLWLVVGLLVSSVHRRGKDGQVPTASMPGWGHQERNE